MDKLPTTITIGGIEYHLAETQLSEHDKYKPHWWWFRYTSYNHQDIPHVRVKSYWYYFSAFEATREEAVNRLMENVKKIQG